MQAPQPSLINTPLYRLVQYGMIDDILKNYKTIFALSQCEYFSYVITNVFRLWTPSKPSSRFSYRYGPKFQTSHRRNRVANITLSISRFSDLRAHICVYIQYIFMHICDASCTS